MEPLRRRPSSGGHDFPLIRIASASRHTIRVADMHADEEMGVAAHATVHRPEGPTGLIPRQRGGPRWP